MQQVDEAWQEHGLWRAQCMALCTARADEGIVNRWLFVRYLVIGLYVGCVTCTGFAWWYISAPVRPTAPSSIFRRNSSPMSMLLLGHGHRGTLLGPTVHVQGRVHG